MRRGLDTLLALRGIVCINQYLKDMKTIAFTTAHDFINFLNKLLVRSDVHTIRTKGNRVMYYEIKNKA